MKEERKFLRQCTCCRKYDKKENLIRITKDHKTNKLEINNSLMQGRSVYICKNKECITNTLKKKRIEHLLNIDVPESIKEKLYTVLNN